MDKGRCCNVSREPAKLLKIGWPRSGTLRWQLSSLHFQAVPSGVFIPVFIPFDPYLLCVVTPVNATL